MRMQGFQLVLCLALSVMGLGCGDDAGGGGDEPSADACNQSGFTQTGCTCSDDRPPGSRVCGEDLTWGACSCPPPFVENACTPGQMVRCTPCADETEGRIVRCLESSTFDCSCNRDAGQDGGGDGDGDGDAGSDSGMNSDNDAG